MDCRDELSLTGDVSGAELPHFTLIAYWDSIESIKKFAEAEYEKAKYYPEDKHFLLEFEEIVTHYEVFHHSYK